MTRRSLSGNSPSVRFIIRRISSMSPRIGPRGSIHSLPETSVPPFLAAQRKSKPQVIPRPLSRVAKCAGRSNSTISDVSRPIPFFERKVVPLPTGPSEVFSTAWQLGSHLGALRRSTRKSKTLSGDSATVIRKLCPIIAPPPLRVVFVPGVWPFVPPATVSGYVAGRPGLVHSLPTAASARTTRTLNPRSPYLVEAGPSEWHNHPPCWEV